MRLWLLALGACALSCGSREPPADSGERPLAKVGATWITEAEFNRFVAGLPAWTASQQEGSARVRDYLQTLIDRALILQEARSRGLEQAPKVRKAVDQALRQRLVEEVEKRELHTRVKVGEEEVKRAYLDRHWNRQLRIAHITTSTPARAAQALAALRAGRPFDAVAREWSENPRTAPHGGEKPYYYTRNNAHPAVRDSLFRLGVGAISGIIPIPKGYEIFQVLDEHKVPYDKIESQVYEELLQERLNAARDAYVDSLAARCGLTPVREGLGVLMRVLRTAQQQGDIYLGEAVAGTALFRYATGQISLGEAVEQSPFIRQAREVQDSMKVDHYLERDVVVPRLLLLRAQELGMDREPELQAWSARRLEEALVLEMRRLEASQKTAVTSQEMQQFYQENKDRYRTSSQVEVVEILVGEQAEAERLLARIRADLHRARPLVALIGRIRQKLEKGEPVAGELQEAQSLGGDPAVLGWLGARLADPRTAPQVIEEISRTAKPEDLVEQYLMRHLAAAHSLRPGSDQVEGCYRLYWYDQTRFGPLVKEAMEAETGALLGPVEHDSFYSIAKVVDQRRSEILSFAEVEKRIRASLWEQREHQLFARWLEALRAERAAEVQRFDENIEALGKTWSAATF